MIQATNELILGIELNEAYAQMTYYHQTVREPVTLGLNSDTEQLLIPMALRQCANGQWQIWDGKPQLESEEPDRVRISDLYRKIEKKEEQEVEEAAELPAESPPLPLTELLPAGLKPEERELLILRFERQLSYKEISDLLYISETACRKRLSRALARCKRLLGGR